MQHSGRQRGRPRQRQPHGGEGVTDVGQHRPGDVHRRRSDDVGDGFPTYEVQGLDGVEALGQHAGRAVPGHEAERGVEPEDVEQRQHQQHHVVGGDGGRVDARALLEVGQQRPVAEHGALGSPAGAGGVEQHSEVLARAGAVECGAVTHQIAVRRSSRDDDRHRRHRAGRRRGRSGRDDDGSAAVGEHVAQLVGGVGRVDREGDQAGPQRAEVDGGELRGVAEVHGDPVTRRETEGQQPAPGGRDLPVEIGPGRRPAVEDQCRLVRAVLRGIADQVGEVA